MTTKELLTLRSKKYIRCQRLRACKMGYFDRQELRKLTLQMAWIEAVLESRNIQLSYLP